MGRKAKLPRHIYWRGGALYGWYYGPDGKTKIKRSTGCTDPAAAAAKLAEWERDAADPYAATRRAAKLKDAWDLLDADRKALIAQGKRAEDSTQMYKCIGMCGVAMPAGLIEAVKCSDDDLDADRLEALWKIGERASLASMCGDAGVRFVDGFIAYRRAHGISENTIAKNRGTMRSAFELAKRAGLWSGDLSAMFPRGFETGYKPRRVRITHEDATRLLAHFDDQPHHRAQVAFGARSGAERQAIWRAHRTDLDSTPNPAARDEDGRPRALVLPGLRLAGALPQGRESWLRWQRRPRFQTLVQFDARPRERLHGAKGSALVAP